MCLPYGKMCTFYRCFLFQLLFLQTQSLISIPAPIAQFVECPLRGTGGHGFDSGPRHTKVVKKWY